MAAQADQGRTRKRFRFTVKDDTHLLRLLIQQNTFQRLENGTSMAHCFRELGEAFRACVDNPERLPGNFMYDNPNFAHA